MKNIATMAVLLLAGLLAAGDTSARPADVTAPDLPRSLPESGPVSVQWTDPARFSEIRYSRNRWEAKRGDWVRELAGYLRKSAANRLAPGERLEVTITDIKRAGEYEPGRGGPGDSIRYLRDIYPPRIDLDFKLIGKDGEVLAEGTRALTDLGYLSRSLRVTDTDPLRYEKRLVDDWLDRQFKAAGR